MLLTCTLFICTEGWETFCWFILGGGIDVFIATKLSFGFGGLMLDIANCWVFWPEVVLMFWLRFWMVCCKLAWIVSNGMIPEAFDDDEVTFCCWKKYSHQIKNVCKIEQL